MTDSETYFRNWAKKQFKGSLIKKIPDFKQAGMGAVVGLPDYVIIYNGETQWWEVKSGFGDTINLKNHFTPGQKIVFKQMVDQGVDPWIFCKTKTKGPRIIQFSAMINKTFIKFE